ncbi:MAG: putative toxin-antitoxin system toxin component, PIN family [Bacteroidetes bacterium GWA2_30_7]|nr:MAG: putative toxin-antitoxin system toxin component, PIN family [Bacteroidetes bacterium GWA2_30_7]
MNHNTDKLNIVLDTNVLLVSISEYSKYHWLYKCIQNNQFNLYITNDILLEYEEVIANKFSVNTANHTIRSLLEFDNVKHLIIYFKSNYILQDNDDNKFVDCAIACNHDYLVSNDKHFNVLKTLDFPKINVITIENFKEELLLRKLI